MPVTEGRHAYPGLKAGLQQITFAIERDEDQRFNKWIWVKIPKNLTVAAFVNRRGHPEDAWQVAKKNHIRGIHKAVWKPLTKKQKKNKKLARKLRKKQKRRLYVPGELRASLSFHVLAGDSPPKITGGYAKFDTVDRPERVGLLSFNGYDPIEMEVPIRFESDRRRNAAKLESDIVLLERMAGRGNFKGVAVGPPPIIRLTTTRGDNTVPLIPLSYQESPQNKRAPLWRIVDIAWGDDTLRTSGGNRYRQLATVTVQQHTNVRLVTRSVTKRSKSKKKSRR
jgi:hypothetical protein